LSDVHLSKPELWSRDVQQMFTGKTGGTFPTADQLILRETAISAAQTHSVPEAVYVTCKHEDPFDICRAWPKLDVAAFSYAEARNAFENRRAELRCEAFVQGMGFQSGANRAITQSINFFVAESSPM